MTKAETYNIDAKKTGTIDLPDGVFMLPWNESLIHQVVVSMQANMRTPVAHAKDRSDVRGGGRKPWRQKGTGRARHGSIRSPIWKGGGVTHGPRNDTKFAKLINKKMRAKALFVVLSKKFKNGEIMFVDKISFGKPSASEAKKSMMSLSTIDGFGGINSKKNNSVLFVTAAGDKVLAKSFANFGNVEVDEVRNLNPVDVLKYKHLVVVSPKESIELLETKEKTVLGSNKKSKIDDAKKKPTAKKTATAKKTSVKKAVKKVTVKK
ncbi:50S ribosomal protein L4 [Candidatus Kaiserbacteria bacterium CG10_big_fil_rev_8_21_14_0_10_43_70]|uniref:Large ribosomal subunit protein uL4 n=1 Tax=Candidatus Kaiserbacteria bacterium CG10_big_fil_rev_8_21_14_0_10_43_70 TaxID=1974605 RepID=A0A2H0UJH7_9BACT|nr:MAG: 50S ribosomal protein L4 [Candidatus Kaiserbacteria bacterium CG10_big_fil_rev_8_21_14_0_10_43_70]